MHWPHDSVLVVTDGVPQFYQMFIIEGNWVRDTWDLSYYFLQLHVSL